MRISKLNAQGLKSFRDFIQEARGGAALPVPSTLLTLALTTEELAEPPELENLPNTLTNYQFARYLTERLADQPAHIVEGTSGMGDQGFWAAIALYYFDLLTPGYSSGRAKPRAVNCYIPETESDMAGMRFFRHRVAGPYRLFKLYDELSEPFLLSPPGEQSGLYTTLTDSAFYTETRCLVEAVNLLYFDPRTKRLRKNYNSKDQPGSLPRLLAVVDQLDLTYDLLGIDGKALLKCLPDEFSEWLPRGLSTDVPAHNCSVSVGPPAVASL